MSLVSFVIYADLETVEKMYSDGLTKARSAATGLLSKDDSRHHLFVMYNPATIRPDHPLEEILSSTKIFLLDQVTGHDKHGNYRPLDTEQEIFTQGNYSRHLVMDGIVPKINRIEDFERFLSLMDYLSPSFSEIEDVDKVIEELKNRKKIKLA